jgi:hypothetical protein
VKISVLNMTYTQQTTCQGALCRLSRVRAIDASTGATPGHPGPADCGMLPRAKAAGHAFTPHRWLTLGTSRRDESIDLLCSIIEHTPQ